MQINRDRDGVHCSSSGGTLPMNLGWLGSSQRRNRGHSREDQGFTPEVYRVHSAHTALERQCPPSRGLEHACRTMSSLLGEGVRCRSRGSPADLFGGYDEGAYDCRRPRAIIETGAHPSKVL